MLKQLVIGIYGRTAPYVAFRPSSDVGLMKPIIKTCTLDILMHLSRSVFSEDQLDLFLWLLTVNNVDNVPSVREMKRLNKLLQILMGSTRFLTMESWGTNITSLPPAHTRRAGTILHLSFIKNY